MLIIKMIFEKLFAFETNVTFLEKIENKYKINRKRNLFISIIMAIYIFGIVCGSLYLSTKYSETLLYVAMGVVLVYVIIVTLIKKFFPKVNLKSTVACLTYFIFPLFLTLEIVSIVGKQNLGFLWLLITLFMFFVLFLSSFYLYLKSMLTFRDDYKIQITMNDNGLIYGTLTSINKNGDYIVNLEGDMTFLINKSYIKMVSYDEEGK